MEQNKPITLSSRFTLVSMVLHYRNTFRASFYELVSIVRRLISDEKLMNVLKD